MRRTRAPLPPRSPQNREACGDGDGGVRRALSVAIGRAARWEPWSVLSRATIARMDDSSLTYRDYARFARLSDEELERQCVAEAFHASGPGGQGVNTADSAVRMRHLPTGIVVTSREQRSQRPCPSWRS